ncbi:unnamed protein product [Acanthoscelides obtectus]|uniref:Uncharacterized protein n=1 Tax=Acanthoscelides obtectus TaxID=200917 RepID=A0A9P0KG94_ACAOB|nr:unnamed protein product [Acanthoscelides obtectus]CAK1642598.1 hypothetical protein AOBTE_LOCUS13129 [Acanthoscelides obtectus]
MPKQSKNKPKYESSETESDEEESRNGSGEEISEDENRCKGCMENNYKTTSKEDWIKCTSCSFWIHKFEAIRSKKKRQPCERYDDC